TGTNFRFSLSYFYLYVLTLTHVWRTSYRLSSSGHGLNYIQSLTSQTCCSNCKNLGSECQRWVFKEIGINIRLTATDERPLFWHKHIFYDYVVASRAN